MANRIIMVQSGHKFFAPVNHRYATLKILWKGAYLGWNNIKSVDNE